MAKNKEIKTNAMRILEREKIPFEHFTYECEEFIDGIQVADMLGLPHEKVYKTLVTVGNSKNYFVFVLPIEAELDLKKAAKISGNKKIEMVHVKDLLGLTGYIRGGCSPVGMKKKFDTYFDETCKNFEKITVSAGVRGCQLLLNTDDITKFTNAKINSLTMEECE